MRRRRNSWLFEGKDGEAGEEMEFEDLSLIHISEPTRL